MPFFSKKKKKCIWQLAGSFQANKYVDQLQWSERVEKKKEKKER
jgi:hypothetical protein